MRILILGATGRTGKWTVDIALKRGHLVHALVRDKKRLRIDSRNVVLFEGTPADKTMLYEAASGCDCILSTLNISRTSDFPWAPLRTPETFLADAMRNIIEVCNNLHLKRVVVCSAWGVHETKNDLPAWFRWFLNHSNIGVAYKGHELQEALLRKSDLDWTIVRPVGLTNFRFVRPILVSLHNRPRPRFTITRQNVARFMIEALENSSYINQTPVISDW